MHYLYFNFFIIKENQYTFNGTTNKASNKTNILKGLLGFIMYIVRNMGDSTMR